jgi:hypothetical protein
VADGDEDAFHAQGTDRARLLDHFERMDLAVGAAEDLLRRDVEDELDLLMGLHALHHDVGGAEGVATVHEEDLRSETGQEEGFLAGGIAAADDRHRDVAVERTVAGRAGGDAIAAVVFLFARDTQETGRSARGDDDGLGFIGGLATDELLHGTREIDRLDAVPSETGAEALGLALHVHDQLIAIHAMDETREVFDLGGRGQLAARLAAFEHQGAQASTGGVDGGSEAGAAGTEDNNVFSHGDGFILRPPSQRQGGKASREQVPPGPGRHNGVRHQHWGLTPLSVPDPVAGGRRLIVRQVVSGLDSGVFGL